MTPDAEAGFAAPRRASNKPSCCTGVTRTIALPLSPTRTVFPYHLPVPQASDINREAKELLRIRDYMDSILAQATGQPFDKASA